MIRQPSNAISREGREVPTEKDHARMKEIKEINSIPTPPPE